MFILFFNCSVTKSCPTIPPHGLLHARLPCPSLSPGVCPSSCPLNQWYHPIISSSVAPFSYCLLSQHQGLFQWVSSSHQEVKVLELQLQHQSFQWIFRTDFLYDWLVWSCCRRDSQGSSPTAQFKSISSLVLSFLYGLNHISIHDYWKNPSFNKTALCQ